MCVRVLPLIVLAAVLSSACATDPSPPVPAQAAPTARPTEATVGAALRDALGGDWDARYFDARVDLNGDGREELLALVAGPMVCGTGGCPVFVMTPNRDGYRLVAQLSVVRPPIRVSSRTTYGWRNLVVGIGGGGIPSGNAELKYDGASYPPNPTVEPAVRITDLGDTEIVIPEFESFRGGKPLPATPSR